MSSEHAKFVAPLNPRCHIVNLCCLQAEALQKTLQDAESSHGDVLNKATKESQANEQAAKQEAAEAKANAAQQLQQSQQRISLLEIDLQSKTLELNQASAAKDQLQADSQQLAAKHAQEMQQFSAEKDRLLYQLQESSKELADAWADKDRLAADLEEEQALHTAAKYEIQQLKAAGDSAAQQLKGQAQELQASSDQLHNQLNQRPAPKDFERLTQQTEQLVRPGVRKGPASAEGIRLGGRNRTASAAAHRQTC